MMLDDDQKKKGVIAASAGNHALALAYHGGQLGIESYKNPKISSLKLFHGNKSRSKRVSR